MSEQTLPPPRGELAQLGATDSQENFGIFLCMAIDDQRRLGPLFLRAVEIVPAGSTGQLEDIAESAAEGQRTAVATLDTEREQHEQNMQAWITRAETAERSRDQLREAIEGGNRLAAELTRERDDAKLTIAEGRATLQQIERERDDLRDKLYRTLESRTALRASALAFLDFKPEMFIPHPDHRRLWNNLRAAVSAIAPEPIAAEEPSVLPLVLDTPLAAPDADVPLGDASRRLGADVSFETPARAGPIDEPAPVDHRNFVDAGPGSN